MRLGLSSLRRRVIRVSLTTEITPLFAYGDTRGKIQHYDFTFLSCGPERYCMPNAQVPCIAVPFGTSSMLARQEGRKRKEKDLLLHRRQSRVLGPRCLRRRRHPSRQPQSRGLATTSIRTTQAPRDINARITPRAQDGGPAAPASSRSSLRAVTLAVPA